MATRQRRMSPIEREQRKWARQSGAQCLKYLRYALHEVYVSDFDLYAPLAVKYARWAWRWALKSQQEQETRVHGDR